MTRVIAGEAGGRRLAVPAGSGTRPTSDRAREGLFGTICSLAGPAVAGPATGEPAAAGSLAGHRVLDLYAGSGAVGLEALSRGAARVTLVEAAAPALRVIRANIAALGLPGADVVADRVERLVQNNPAAPAYTVVFADPPYAMPDGEMAAVLTALRDNGWLAPGALVVVERATRSGPLTWPDGYVPDRARRYGEATFWYGLAGSR